MARQGLAQDFNHSIQPPVATASTEPLKVLPSHLANA